MSVVILPTNKSATILPKHGIFKLSSRRELLSDWSIILVFNGNWTVKYESLLDVIPYGMLFDVSVSSKQRV